MKTGDVSQIHIERPHGFQWRVNEDFLFQAKGWLHAIPFCHTGLSVLLLMLSGASPVLLG
jgi:hypothetical protein